MRRRNSLRKPGWYYASPGYYFVTINVKGGWYWFGVCREGRMRLSAIGEVVEKEWKSMANEWSFLELDEFVVMPNHIHALIKIKRSFSDQGSLNRRRGAINRARTEGGGSVSDSCAEKSPMVQRGSVSSIVRKYKARVTYRARKINPEFAWHRNFYESIVKDEVGLQKVRRYIKNNPKNWRK